ncbi:protein adenylyltransferase SelO [Paraburkholderia fynbosensis]|uniref:Protein nucleotidyltransferase YdiU n=1 Tax=Paraburkholderia fynbosensis TaxID=1200993 RepID=A0A6J5FAX4_9BURK|nr:YdiU family protein [Paraburkholderia fynbosensis]CAB3776505.1 Protein adenylyltransferase SelO [Paraburkholderia fynbosensis]
MSFSPSIAGLSEALTAFSNVLLSSPESAFARLGSTFLTRLPAAPLNAPYMVGFSAETAALLGLTPDLRNDAGFVELFSGNVTREWPADALPYASVYSGHQFGVWAGQLGDGRALGLGEVEHDGQRFELQLKGAGRTPYSRMGDGRAVLRSSIREYLCSEAMHHLGIPTTRALCVIGSDQPVRRETVETAAVVTRVAPSFVRFGHFEHFYSNDRTDALRALADHVIERFYPHCRDADDPYLALLNEAVLSTADLMVEWQAVGFCHGVMNTDNMSILGLTIDYGPFGFMDGFDAGYICNHSDTQGRYAYRMQPQIAYWNLFCLAQGLLPLLGEQHAESVRGDKAIEDAQRVLGGFKDRFAPALERRMRAKLGLDIERDGDDTLVNRLFEVMHANRADFTLTFRHLARVSKHDASGDAPVRDLFLDRAAFDAWANDYRARLSHETRDDAARAIAMNRVNPKFVLRNHLAETAIRHAKEKDFSEVERLAAVLRRPFDEQPEHEAYAALPPDWASSLEVSCSS